MFIFCCTKSFVVNNSVLFSPKKTLNFPVRILWFGNWMEINNTELLEKAKQAKTFAQAKYSGFKVGAALLSEKGDVFTGCNVESSSYGLTICAERVALTKALSEGVTNFISIAIFAGEEEATPPCGACRQLLYDYAPNLEIILKNKKSIEVHSIKNLLPKAFNDSQLRKK
jgi:cytidine deaminase